MLKDVFRNASEALQDGFRNMRQTEGICGKKSEKNARPRSVPKKLLKKRATLSARLSSCSEHILLLDQDYASGTIARDISQSNIIFASLEAI